MTADDEGSNIRGLAAHRGARELDLRDAPLRGALHGARQHGLELPLTVVRAFDTDRGRR
jgi:hypothetical protein